MRILALLFTLALLTAGGLGWAGELQEEGFGARLNGLVLRVRKALGARAGSPLLQPLEVEIRVPGKSALDPTETFAPKLVLTTADGKPLPEGILEFPRRSPLESASVRVQPGKPLKWTVNLMRASDKAPTQLKLFGFLRRLGDVRSPPLASQEFELDLSKLPVPKTLERKHISPGWTSATVLVYHLYGGLNGWRSLHVDPDGTCEVFRSESGKHDENDLPSGLFAAVLTPGEREALAKSFEKQQVWRLDDLPKRMLLPDESSATFTLLADDAALFARYPIAEAQKANEDYAAFEKELDALMHRIVKRAQKGKR